MTASNTDVLTNTRNAAVGRKIVIRDDLENEYSDMYTSEVLGALETLSHFNA